MRIWAYGPFSCAKNVKKMCTYGTAWGSQVIRKVVIRV
jgi:hypothetical protein